MTQHARNIKDLCIALEALSRFPNPEELREEIHNLLDNETAHMRKEQRGYEEPTPIYAPTRPPPGADDDIPF